MAFIEQLAHTQLAALQQLRLQGFPELPRVLPHAPRVKRDAGTHPVTSERFFAQADSADDAQGRSARR